ncbi:hypothetical protein FNV43_RR15756 [Rhamnella rubrinervis]|uniref:Uncharacterized protein n=1 Tax=Rhamnella rubrinervis TaxID=2594499 RepID=A0A8K0E7Z8_9ROSA|nr:hypothetical protein FNV43_RR15756 [Rhamnella rubrinervis]
MASPNVFKTLKKVFLSYSTAATDQEIADKIAKTLITAGLKPLQTTPSLLSNLNSRIHLVLSNPHLPLHSCLFFFNFLCRNQSLAQNPDRQAHVTPIYRLFEARAEVGIEMEVPGPASFLQVKQQIKEIANVEEDRQTLFYNQVRLEDEYLVHQFVYDEFAYDEYLVHQLASTHLHVDFSCMGWGD